MRQTLLENKRRQKIDSLKERKHQDELISCTFQPNVIAKKTRLPQMYYRDCKLQDYYMIDSNHSDTRTNGEGQQQSHVNNFVRRDDAQRLQPGLIQGHNPSDRSNTGSVSADGVVYE
jgi:hypothetical protein